MSISIDILKNMLVKSEEVKGIFNSYISRLGFSSDEQSKKWAESVMAVYFASRNITSFNRDYGSSKMKKVEGIMIHSTGCPGMSAEEFIDRYYRAYYVDRDDNISSHAVIDCSGKIYHILPWTDMATHSGGGYYDSYISVVLCEPEAVSSDSTNEEVDRVFNSAVELSALLCIIYGLEPMSRNYTRDYNVLIGHNEAHNAVNKNLGFKDPVEYWQMMNRNHSMDNLRSGVVSKMNELGSSVESAAARLMSLVGDLD